MNRDSYGSVCPACGVKFGGRTIGAHIKRCPKGVKPIDLFWQKVNKAGAGGCWLWTGAVEGRGYGHFRTGRKDYRAHHVAWEHFNGPRGTLHVLHRCDVRNCVNPAHLFLGTHEQNMADCRSKGRHTHGEKNPSAKLNPEKVREIRRDYRDATTGHESNALELSAKYGVSNTAIYAAATRRTWKTIQ